MEMERKNNGLKSTKGQNPVNINGRRVMKKISNLNRGLRIYRKTKHNISQKIPRLWRRRNSRSLRKSNKTLMTRSTEHTKGWNHSNPMYLQILRSNADLETIIRLVEIKLQVGIGVQI
ncbi:uncharacterized protein LOC133193684 isoform X2 [Saccostrea echinata]|uniref:uncharacterized protein LOC133193684 isoform X2 n=1 Tax=Saccostrea echinata TaxID=191078 RepID=UPI002A83F965|nr:uncharacterized protein LOC133193684 isoform X2 [Saccostrea echinata]